MENMPALGPLFFVIALFVLVWSILWLVLPFIIMSMSRKMDISNRRLQKIIDLMESQEDIAPNIGIDHRLDRQLDFLESESGPSRIVAGFESRIFGKIGKGEAAEGADIRQQFSRSAAGRRVAPEANGP